MADATLRQPDADRHAKDFHAKAEGDALACPTGRLAHQEPFTVIIDVAGTDRQREYTLSILAISA